MLPAHCAGVSLQRMSLGCTKVGIAIRASLTNAICRKAFAMVSSFTHTCCLCTNSGSMLLELLAP
jgi:hypothetical protein